MNHIIVMDIANSLVSGFYLRFSDPENTFIPELEQFYVSLKGNLLTNWGMLAF